MKIDFFKELTTIDGDSPLMQKDEKTKEDKPMTLADVCVQALLSPYQDETSLSAEDKIRRYNIAAAIARTKEDEKTVVKAEDITLIKTLVAKAYAPLVVGQTSAFLEGEDQE